MRLYHPDIYDWSKPVDSHWEQSRDEITVPRQAQLQGDEVVDVAIIGGGYCGLSAAYHLASRDVGVAVLEAGAIGWGASGRNGGFCSIGASFLGPVELRAKYGESETLSFYRALVEAVGLVEQLSRHEKFDIGRQGDGVWTFAHKPSRLKELQDQADILRALGVKAAIVDTRAFSERAFECTESFGALYEPVGFGLHPLKFCLGLASAAADRGAQLCSRSEVIEWRREGAQHRLVSRTGSVRARQVIVATNAWLPEDLVPELAGRVLPIMSNITVTERISAAMLEAQNWKTENPASNTRAHLAYLRMLPDQRLLFGGRGDTTGHPSGLIAMRHLLEKRRERLFPYLASVRTGHSWRGLIAATRRLTPAVSQLASDPSVLTAFGCHGNGVAFMTWAGRALARMVLREEQNLPAAVQGLPGKFPLPSLRLWALRLMLARAALEDEWA